MLLDQSRESLHVRVDVWGQPHGCSGSAGRKVRGSWQNTAKVMSRE
jgi:hypothetical protein